MDNKKKGDKKQKTEEVVEEKSRAWPKADNQMSKQILDLCNQAVFYK